MHPTLPSPKLQHIFHDLNYDVVQPREFKKEHFGYDWSW